jgi:non-structural maintenance of chromosomes element 4
MAQRMKMSESPALDFEDDIYDATPAPSARRRAGNAAPGAVSMSQSPSPGISFSSDKENSSRNGTGNKGKGRAAMPPPKLPTLLSDADQSGKRKRTEECDAAAARLYRRHRTVEPEEDDLDDFDASYNPEQDVEERRRIRRELRDIAKDLNDHRAEYLHPESTGLVDTLNKANQISSAVKQTADATIDSRLLVTTADLSYKKTVQITLGESVQGVDVDEFVSKCISFMRRVEITAEDSSQRPPSNTHRQRRRQTQGNESEDGGGDEGDMLNWEYLGRFSCLQHNARPAVPGFLLGPLSLEKRARKPVQRNPGLKHSNLRQTQPEEISAEDMETSDSNLTVLCTKILARLKKVQDNGQAAVEREATDDMTDMEIKILMNKHGVHARGGVDYWKFVVNPHSFGQTIENMFYVSFLIRDGKAGITIDDDGLPAVGRSL